VDASIERYLAALDRADREPGDVAEAKTDRIKEKLSGLRHHMQFLKEMEHRVAAAPDHQVSLTDPDARSMNSSGRGTGIVGYNLQAAVDTKHHLIVAHAVVTEGNDRGQLVPMGLDAKHAMGVDEITVIADRGYYNGDQVLACEGTGMLPCIPKSHTAIGIKTGMFSRHDFVYDAEQDHYICPAGATLTKATARSDRRDDMDQYRNLAACHTCALRPRCTPEKVKRVMRWKHEGVLDVMQARLDHMSDAMIQRRKTVEHVFGTLKSWSSSAHLLTKTLEKVRTEMSLSVLAYNIKRMIRLFGVQPLIQAIRT